MSNFWIQTHLEGLCSFHVYVSVPLLSIVINLTHKDAVCLEGALCMYVFIGLFDIYNDNIHVKNDNNIQNIQNFKIV